MSKFTVTKQIPMSQQLMSFAEERMQQLGIKFPEYIRHLILEDTKELMKSIPFVTEEEEEQIAASMKDYQEGRFTVLKTDKDIEDFVHNLTKK